MAKIAIPIEGDTIFKGHFAHAPEFLIYGSSSGEARLEERRSNPLSYSSAEEQDSPIHRYHGSSKYEFLRSKVLGDIDVLVVGGGCMTSIYYFMSQAVKLVFVDRDDNPVEASRVADAIASRAYLGQVSVYSEGSLVEVDNG